MLPARTAQNVAIAGRVHGSFNMDST